MPSGAWWLCVLLAPPGDPFRASGWARSFRPASIFGPCVPGVLGALESAWPLCKKPNVVRAIHQWRVTGQTDWVWEDLVECPRSSIPVHESRESSSFYLGPQTPGPRPQEFCKEWRWNLTLAWLVQNIILFMTVTELKVQRVVDSDITTSLCLNTLE